MSNHLIQYNTSGIRQKGKSQNGCFKKTKHAKFLKKNPTKKQNQTTQNKSLTHINPMSQFPYFLKTSENQALKGVQNGTLN